MFDIIHGLTADLQIIKRITQDVIKDFVDDGVIYLELRTTPLKLIISIDRKRGKEQAEENLELAVEAKKDHPGIVTGIDFSGLPGAGDIDDFLPILEKARSCGFPLSVHCAEIPDERETEKILRIKPERLGHGTCIHPDAGGSDKLWNLLLDYSIPIELCMTSNVKTGTVVKYENHHFDYLQKHGHPIMLGTDDKGVFSTTLSEEYCIAAKTFGLNIEQLWQLSYDSISYSFANESEKTKLTQTLMEWKQNMMTK
ncbi:hypothetical protein J437_LFUL012012 [Ladona fulva]|uniref:Adenosine deaminase domain-containing protein n=1 Tax=Ladona fulva TaxID=123851 RepID=A0A8K0KDF9_LADFU|nr:hypothetical protein J437_LFUL012012 [Ladona fulva]